MDKEFEINEEEEKEIVKEVKDFIDSRSKFHSIDVEDFKVSKNYSSGNSFSIVNKSNIWKRDRANVSANILEPIVNSVVYRFTEDPFDFTGSGFEKEELVFQLSSCLREACIDGVAYLLTAQTEEGVNFSRLNNFNTLYGECVYADGKDVQQVVFVDKEKCEEGKRPDKTGISEHLETVLNFENDEIPVMTYWKKTDTGVITYEIKGSKVTNKTEQNLPRIPVVRIYGKEMFIEYERNWRGFYYIVKKILLTIDYELSLIQERIACAPTEAYLVASESLGKNLEDWTKINDIPKAFRAYNALSVTGTPLPPPIQNSFILGIEELILSVNKHQDLVSVILGNQSGENVGNETAEAVLLRRENKNTAVNELLKNLLDSSWEIAGIISAFTGQETLIENGIFVKAKRDEDLEKLVAFGNIIHSNATLAAMKPLLIKKMSLSEEDSAELAILLNNAGQPNPELLEAQAKLQQASAEISNLQNALKQAIANNEAQLAAAQLRYQSDMEKKQLDYELKLKDQQLKEKELELKYQTEVADLTIKARNAATEYQLKADEIVAKATGMI